MSSDLTIYGHLAENRCSDFRLTSLLWLVLSIFRVGIVGGCGMWMQPRMASILLFRNSKTKIHRTNQH